MPTPEGKARELIDQSLKAAGWHVQDRDALNLGAALGITVREFPLQTGFTHCLLFLDRRTIGIVEAKAVGPQDPNDEPASILLERITTRP